MAVGAPARADRAAVAGDAAAEDSLAGTRRDERGVFVGQARGDDETLAEVTAAYRAACAQSNGLAGGAGSIPFEHRIVGAVSLRFIYLGMIAEVACSEPPPERFRIYSVVSFGLRPDTHLRFLRSSQSQPTAMCVAGFLSMRSNRPEEIENESENGFRPGVLAMYWKYASPNAFRSSRISVDRDSSLTVILTAFLPGRSPFGSAVPMGRRSQRMPGSVGPNE